MHTLDFKTQCELDLAARLIRKERGPYLGLSEFMQLFVMLCADFANVPGCRIHAWRAYKRA